MAVSDVLSVRVDPEMLPRLERIVESTGLPISTIVRIALKHYLDEIESSGEIRIRVAPTESTKTSYTINALNEGSRHPKK